MARRRRTSATSSDPILAERGRLGPIQVHAVHAPSMVGAHGALGALVAEPARAAIEKRLAATPPARLAAQLAIVRASWSFMEGVAARATTPAPVRRALGEYLECLGAWSEGVGLGACAGERRASAVELALWAQDDNAGCQTGLLRRADRSVLLWHTEEDTLGFFDAPRVVSLVVRGEALSSFVYPYLLPGPAFGWGGGQVHAVDSLHLKREGTPAGAFTSVASWLVWRLGREVPAREALRALSPYVDGCAINVVQASPRGVTATTHEIGGRRVQSRRLGQLPGAADFQVNVVCRAESPLAREQTASARERARYEGRIRRTREALERLSRRGDEPSAPDLLRMMANRRGQSYAYANLDVKAHCVAHVTSAGITLHVGSGAAHPGDVYRPEPAERPPR